jgi:hypothetical protein
LGYNALAVVSFCPFRRAHSDFGLSGGAAELYSNPLNKKGKYWKSSQLGSDARDAPPIWATTPKNQLEERDHENEKLQWAKEATQNGGRPCRLFGGRLERSVSRGVEY